MGENTALSGNSEGEPHEENGVSFANRDVFICKGKFPGRREWAFRERGQPDRDGCSRIIETGFNGWDLCSFNKLVKYIDYLGEINRNTKNIKTILKKCGLYLEVWNRETQRARG